jgi:hypothetical protein
MLSQQVVLADRPRPGSPSHRAERMEVVVPYTAKMAAIENDYHSRGLIDIVMCDDPWYHLTRDMVREATSRWLGIPHRNIGVDFFPPTGFLVLLPSLSIRDRVLDNNNGHVVGQVRIQLLPWTRLIGAETSKLSFKVRLRIEGILHHARQAATICQLLS